MKIEPAGKYLHFTSMTVGEIQVANLIYQMLPSGRPKSMRFNHVEFLAKPCEVLTLLQMYGDDLAEGNESWIKEILIQAVMVSKVSL